MKIGKGIRSLFSHDSEEVKSWPSVVILLRRAQHYSIEDLSKMADAAWGMNEAQGRVSPKVVETRKNGAVFQLAPQIYVSIFQEDQQYSFGITTASASSDSPLSRMWAEHTAWCAVDVPNRYNVPTNERRECYKLLFHFVNKAWGTNVCGLYLPAEERQFPCAMPSQIPNLGDLIASFKWSATNQSQNQARVQ
jgi:hypothetical protein